MGQRHQVFIIARVIPHGNTDGKAYYRCVGAYHHQWCYGCKPLYAADRFLTLVKKSVNAAIIREELNSIQGKYGRYGLLEPKIPDAPCLYSICLLASAFNISLDDDYVHGGGLESSLLEAWMGCWDGDNNDGITVLDITDPLNPAYAFAQDSEPLTAEGYVSGYYDTRSEEEGNKERLRLISRFDSIPVLAKEALAEAWPSEFKVTNPVNTETIPAVIPVAHATSSGSTDDVPALADLILEPVVMRSLELGNADDLDLLIPSKHVQIKNVLRARNPFPDSGLPLLVAVLQQEQRNSKEVETVNLTGFSLSPEQLVSIASQLETTRIVILSHSPEVKPDHVRALLIAKPQLDRLELLDTGITNQEFSSLLNDHPELFKCVSDILHLHLISKAQDTNPGCFHVFASQSDNRTIYGGFDRNGHVHGSAPAIRIWTPTKVVRNIVDFLTVIITSTEYSINPLQSLMVPAAMSAGLRKPGIPWKDRTVTMWTQNVQELHVNGWLFLFSQAAPYRDEGEHKYAFAKILPGGDGVQTYDITGFLDEMKREGRKPLPTPDLVLEFKNLLVARALDNSTASFYKPSPTTLFDNDSATKFVASVFPAARGILGVWKRYPYGLD